MKKDLEQIIQDKNSDTEMIEMAETDLDQMKIKKQNYENKLKIFLFPKDEDDDKMQLSKLEQVQGIRSFSFLCRFI